MPAQAKRRRTSTSSGPTPLKPSLMSPVTPREPESSEDGAATADAVAFKPPPAKKRPKKRKKKAAKPKKKKSAPPPDSDSDSDDGLSLAELNKRVKLTPSPDADEADADAASQPSSQPSEPSAAREFKLGDKVVLAPGDFNFNDKNHPLAMGPGVVHKVEDDPDDDEPYQVIGGKDGATTYWYEVGHLAAAPAGDSAAGSPEAASRAEPEAPAKPVEEKLESRLLSLADDDDDEDDEMEAERAAQAAKTRRRQAMPESDSEEEEEDAGRAAAAETKTASEDSDAEPVENPDETWELVNTWVSIEFDDDKEGKGTPVWHDCLVVDYDKTTDQHLVKWAETAKEEWLPALKPGEFRSTESQAKRKCSVVVFDQNVKLPPVNKPDLEGTTYKVIKPVPVTLGPARDSTEIGTCKVGQIVKVLKACALNGQLRVMFAAPGLQGWTSVASRKGAKFLKKTKQRLFLTKDDKRTIKKLEKRHQQEEERKEANHAELKKQSAALTEGWIAAVAKAELRASKQYAAAEATFDGQSGGGSEDQESWRQRRRSALTGAEESEEEAEEEPAAPQDDASEQQPDAAAGSETGSEPADTNAAKDTAAKPAPTGLQAHFAARAAGAVVLQQVVRTVTARRKFLALREAVIELQAAVRGLLAEEKVHERRLELIAELKEKKTREAAQKRAAAERARAVAAGEGEDDDDGIDWGAVDLNQVEQQAAQQQQQQQQQQTVADDDGSGKSFLPACVL